MKKTFKLAAASFDIVSEVKQMLDKNLKRTGQTFKGIKRQGAVKKI